MAGVGALKRLIWLAFYFGLAITLSAQSRRALVIGNGNYRDVSPAAQASASARSIARALADSGFQVSLLPDADAEALVRGVTEFLRQMQPGDVGVFYFSGYAVQSVGENYLLPVSYSPVSEAAIEFQGYSLKRLIRFFEAKEPAAGIVILDAAPPPPEIEKKFPESGLALTALGSANIVLTYSSLPGKSVPPAPTREASVFSVAWAQAIAQPGLSLDGALRQVKQQVGQASEGHQIPADFSTLVKEFSFRPRSAAANEWDRIGSSTDTVVLDGFRRRFPADPLAQQAATRIRSLEWERALASGTPEAVDDFLRRFPGHSDATRWVVDRKAADKALALAGIKAAVDKVGAAYAARDLEALQSIRPTLTPQERKRLEDAFRMFKTIRYELRPSSAPDLHSSGDTAMVKCRLEVEMRAADGSGPPKAEQRVTVKLRRTGETWVVESVQ